MSMQWCHKMSIGLRAAVAALVCLAFAFSASAIDWTGAGDGVSWNDPANWSGGVVPGPSDTAIVNGAMVTVSSAVAVQNVTLNQCVINGPGDLTVTGTLSIPDGGTFSGNGRLIVAPGATASMVSLSQAMPLVMGRRMDINGQLTLSGAVTSTLSASTTVGAGGTFTSTANTVMINGGAVLTNNGELTIRSWNVTMTGNGRIVNNGVMTMGGSVVNQPVVVDAAASTFGFQSISGSGIFSLSGAGGVNFVNGDSAYAIAGPVNITGGPVTVNGHAVFSQTITVDASASLTLRPVGGSPLPLNGNPAINSAGPVTFDGGIYPLAYPLAGTGPLSIFSADLQFASDVTLNRQVTMNRTTVPQPAFSGVGVVTIAGQFNWLKGELRGTADFVIAPGGVLNVGSPSLQSEYNRTWRTIRNQGTINTYVTNQDFSPADTSGSIANSGVVNILSLSTCLVPLDNLPGGMVRASVAPGAGGVEATWNGLTHNAGTVRVLAGAFSVAGLAGQAIDGPGVFQSDAGATLRLGSTNYGTTGTLVGPGTIAFGGVHDLGTNYAGTGGFGVAQYANVTLRRAIAPPNMLAIDGRLTLTTDQQWSNVRLTGALAGPGVLTVGNSLVLGGVIDTDATVVLSPQATMTTTGQYGALKGTLTNLGSVAITTTFAFDGGLLTNQGTLVMPLNSAFVTSGPTSRLVNSGTIRVNGTSVNQVVELPGPDPQHNGRSALRLENTGAIALQGGQLLINGGGFSTTPINIPANGTLEFNVPFSFATPVATTGSGTLRLGQAAFDLTNSRIESTGFIEMHGTITLGSALPASASITTSGTITLLTDQTWLPGSLSGVIRGPGNLTIAPYLNPGPGPDWQNGGTLEGPGTVRFAPGVTIRTQGASPLVVKTQLINEGTFISSRLRLEGGSLDNRGSMSIIDRVEAAAPGGLFTNNGTLSNSTGIASVAGGPSPVQFRNNGIVSVTGGSLTIAQPLNYDDASKTLAGGTWIVGGTGVLTLTGVDIRTIAPATSLSLLSSGASFSGLTNLTSNSGTLILGPGRTQNINPVGGTFTNSGELSLRVGSLFNVVGNFIQTALGTLRTQVGGPAASQIGRLAATGSVTLGGTVITEYLNGYTPASCNATLPFINASSVSGTFANTTTAPINGRVSRVVVGASIAALSVRNPADVATIGGLPPGDNALTADDVIMYLNAFFSNNLSIADVAALGGALTPDGVLSPDDLIAFLNSFFAGCN